MRTRRLLLFCLLFSGLSALVYQVVWTRLLGFAFGTTTEAIGTVLGVFFGGMALGNWLAARWLSRVTRPLRVYAILELGIGVFALLSLPILRSLDGLYGLAGADAGTATFSLLRLLASTAVLLPPTIAMGATLPVVAHGLVDDDETLGRWSSYIYSANTLGAVLGAYLCGFWMIPSLGLTTTVVTAAWVNLAVAVAVWVGAGSLKVGAGYDDRAAAREETAEVGRPGRHWYLAFFGISGFVAIGYEIIWSKIFTIVMEGTLYGFSTVLSAYLLGLALGSLAIAKRVDRIRDLPRAFGLLHLGIAVCVAAGILVVSDLPYWHDQISPRDGGGGIHRLYLIAAPIVLLPTALFGAAFPVLIRLYTTSARGVGRGVGLATAINTAGSIAASLSISFLFIDALGIDATLYLLLMLEMGVGLAVLLRFQDHIGWERMRTALPALAVAACVTGLYDGVHVERAVTGRWVGGTSLDEYRTLLDRKVSHTALVIEGKTSVVTVHSGREGWALQNNGMPEAAFQYAPPYRALEALLLGILPYVVADDPQRALVVGFGGGSTLDGLMQTDLADIEVVELEKGVVAAIPVLYRGRPSPLDDPRVDIRVNDGRNELLRGRHRGGHQYDVIASQPSHPWLAGAANLFTREYFELARDNLSDGGVFSVWVNGFHIDRESLLSIVASFQAVFPGSLLVGAGDDDPYSSFILLGSRDPVRLDLARIRERLAEPELAQELGLHGITSVEDVLIRFEGPAKAFSDLWDGPANDDDNAYVETRLSRMRSWSHVDFEPLERALPPTTPLWTAVDGSPDIAAMARTILPRIGHEPMTSYRRKLGRLISVHGQDIGPFELDLLEAEAEALAADAPAAGHAPLEQLANSHIDRPEPWRALGRHTAVRERNPASAARAFAEAWKRSRASADAAATARFAFLAGAHSDAATWLDRVPEPERDRFEFLAPVRASVALGRSADHDELMARQLAVTGWRETAEGRNEPGLSGLMASLARALGREDEARSWSDLDFRERRGRASTLFSALDQTVAEGNWEAAAEGIERISRLLPGDPRISSVGLEVAVARRDPESFARHIEDLRRYAPTLSAAVATENRARAKLGLPLLPQQSPEDLMGHSAGPR